MDPYRHGRSFIRWLLFTLIAAGVIVVFSLPEPCPSGVWLGLAIALGVAVVGLAFADMVLIDRERERRGA